MLYYFYEQSDRVVYIYIRRLKQIFITIIAIIFQLYSYYIICIFFWHSLFFIKYVENWKNGKIYDI